MDEAEGVFDVIFSVGHVSAEVVHPGKEPFHLPPSSGSDSGGAFDHLESCSRVAYWEQSSRCRIFGKPARGALRLRN